MLFGTILTQYFLLFLKKNIIFSELARFSLLYNNNNKHGNEKSNWFEKVNKYYHKKTSNDKYL